jgi:ATP phosphoribosyltransferase
MRGLTIVIAILVIHLICVLGIMIKFMMGSRFSMVGEAWHVVAQLVSGGTDTLLVESSLKTDKQVKKWLKMRRGNTRVGVQRNEDSERVEVRDLA